MLFFSIGKAQEPPSSEDYNYNTFEAQKKWIVGTFLCDEDDNWELEFTKDGKCHERFLITDSKPEEYTYRLEYSTRKADTPSGHMNIYTLYLKAVPADSNEDLTYEMAVSDTGLALYPWPMGIGGQFVFSRVKTKSTPAPISKPEPEKESEPSPKWQLKLSDYDRGHFEGGLAYEQCKKEQEKEGRDVLDRDRRKPIESARMRPTAYQAVLDDCIKQAFKG